MNPTLVCCVLLILFALILRPAAASGSVVGVFIVLGCMVADLAAARARGRSGGRPGITPEKKAALEALASDPEKRPGEICKALGISRATFYKYAPCRGDSARVAIRQRS